MPSNPYHTNLSLRGRAEGAPRESPMSERLQPRPRTCQTGGTWHRRRTGGAEIPRLGVQDPAQRLARCVANVGQQLPRQGYLRQSCRGDWRADLGLVMAGTWNDLAALRLRGMRPELPVYVTDRWMLAKNMTDVGCLAVLHRRGEPMPVLWLDGLDVRLDFGRCERSGVVHRLLRRRAIEPKSLRVWCECAQDFVATCGPCDLGDEPWAG